jgi:ribosomal protein L39E
MGRNKEIERKLRERKMEETNKSDWIILKIHQTYTIWH